MENKQMTFRFNRDLIELARAKAKAQNRSLNNYIESLLFREVGYIPNKETIAAIEEARDTVNIDHIDDIDRFFDEVKSEIR